MVTVSFILRRNPKKTPQIFLFFGILLSFAGCVPLRDQHLLFRIISIHIGNTGNLPMLLVFKGKCNPSLGVSSHLVTEGRLEVL